jgi:hypothetical protein
MNRAAFTLLETLLATSLAASVGIAALSLTSMQARIGAAARMQEAALALISETERLLDDDILLAVTQPPFGRYRLLEHGALQLVTSNRLPGESPGLHEVTWRFDEAAGALLRISTALDGGAVATRTVGRSWKAYAIVLDHDVLWLTGRIGDSTIAWQLPLWMETR